MNSAAVAKQQWRIVMASTIGRAFTVFVDAVDEPAARAFAAQAFPKSTVAMIRLEPVDPCAAYERRPPR